MFPVEVKVNVGGNAAEAVAALATSDALATTRQIWFAELAAGVDGGELTLLANHVIVRLRSGEGPDDLTVKLRPCQRSQLIGPWRAPFETESLDYRIEGDWSGRRRVLAASAVSEHPQGSLLSATRPDADLAGVFTKKQRRFLRQCAPADMPIENLIALGPIDSTKWAKLPLGGGEVNVERWTVEELDFVELSIRVKPKREETSAEFEQRAAGQLTALEESVRELGLPIDEHPITKTQRVLTTLAATVRTP